MASENRVEVGHICMKGPHPAWKGNTDFGVCGSKAFATIYLTIEVDFPNPRGEAYTAEEAAESLAELVAAAEKHGWCEYNATSSV